MDHCQEPDPTQAGIAMHVLKAMLIGLVQLRNQQAEKEDGHHHAEDQDESLSRRKTD